MEKKIIITEKAQEALSVVMREKTKEFVNMVSSYKSIPGEEEIEITSQDIKRFSPHIFIAMPRKRMFPFKVLVLSYAVLGIMLIFCSIFYEIAYDMFVNNKTQFILLLTGILLLLFAFLAYLMEESIKYKRRISTNNVNN